MHIFASTLVDGPIITSHTQFYLQYLQVLLIIQDVIGRHFKFLFSGYNLVTIEYIGTKFDVRYVLKLMSRKVVF